jgi:hypothetical protein
MFQVLVLTSKEMDEELGGYAVSEALLETLREKGIDIVNIMARLGTEI